MNAVFVRRLLMFVVPALVLMVGYAGIPKIAALPPVKQELALFAPYLVIAGSMLLSLHFHSGRVFYFLSLLGVGYFALRTHVQGMPAGPSALLTAQALSLFLPVNILLFAFMRERGIFTFAGRLRLAFVALQGMLLLWWLRTGNLPFPLPPPPVRDTGHFVNVASLALPGVGILLLITKVLIRQSPIDSGFLGALAAVVIATMGDMAGLSSPVFLSAAAAILGLSVLQDSYNMAYRDELTGLPSRRALNREMQGLGRQYVVAMVDVDHFKNFNDTFGHDTGDQALRMVASKLMGVRGGGKAFRYGGEEFTILFPRKDLSQAVQHLEELRKIIAEYKLWIRSNERPKDEKGKKNRGNGASNQYVSVTVSIGVAEATANLRHSDDVLKAADKALYKAKHKGRNQVCS